MSAKSVLDRNVAIIIKRVSHLPHIDIICGQLCKDYLKVPLSLLLQGLPYDGRSETRWLHLLYLHVTLAAPWGQI